MVKNGFKRDISNCKGTVNQYRLVSRLKSEFDNLFSADLDNVNLVEARVLSNDIEEAISRIEESMTVSLEMAEEILGFENVISPEDIYDAFKVIVRPEEIPQIPFTISDLEIAKKLGQQLVLYVHHTPSGSLLTVSAMNQIRDGQSSNGKKLFNGIATGSRDFCESAPINRWKLASKSVLRTAEKADGSIETNSPLESREKNYLEQTETLIYYLVNQVFKDKPLPNEYQVAIREFEEIKEKLKNLVADSVGKGWSSDDPSGAELCSIFKDLKISNLLRETAAEISYRLIITDLKTGRNILKDAYTTTSERFSEEEGERCMVCIGNSLIFPDREGTSTAGNFPSSPDSGEGTTFSRSI